MSERLLKPVNILSPEVCALGQFPALSYTSAKAPENEAEVANLLISELFRLLRHHDARKLQPVIITLRWLELGSS